MSDVRAHRRLSDALAVCACLFAALALGACLDDIKVHRLTDAGADAGKHEPDGGQHPDKDSGPAVNDASTTQDAALDAATAAAADGGNALIDSSVDDAGEDVDAGDAGLDAAALDPCTMCELATHTDPNDNTSVLSTCPDAYHAGKTLSGVAGAGTGAGRPKSVLFEELLECVHSSHCAQSFNDSDCYCGAGVDPNACLGTGTVPATGPCKAQVEAAGESPSIVQLQARYYDPAWALGAAFNVVETCDYTFCGADICL